jgi:16S rRNA processing protein RimM
MGESTPRTRLVVAQVRSLHGLHGVVRVEVLTDRPEDRFVAGHVLHPEGGTAPLTISEAAAVEDGPGWRLRFREIRDRQAAESLRDAYLEMEVDRATDLEPGAAYWHEVIGTEVRGLDGTVLGKVADIYRVASAEIYVVRGGPPGEFDLPVVKDIVRVFAPERGEIVVDEAILDLDSAPVDEPKVRPARRRPRWSRHGKGGAAAKPADGNATDSPTDEAPTSGNGGEFEGGA